MPQARERKNCSRRRRPYDGRMSMSITCPQCGLTQETPADRICRGCANAISSLVAPARSVLGLGKEAAAKAIPVGARVAGVVLLLNAAANALTMIKQGPGSDPLAHHEVKGMIVDLIVGGGLLAGKANLQKWAIVRVVLGMIVFGAAAGRRRQPRRAGRRGPRRRGLPRRRMVLGSPRKPLVSRPRSPARMGVRSAALRSARAAADSARSLPSFPPRGVEGRKGRGKGTEARLARGREGAPARGEAGGEGMEEGAQGRQAPRSRRRLAAVGDRQASTFLVVVGVNVKGDGDGDVAGPGKLPSRLTAAAAKSP